MAGCTFAPKLGPVHIWGVLSAWNPSSLAASEIVRDNSAAEARWAQRVTAASGTCSIPARGGLLLLVWVLLLLVGPRTVSKYDQRAKVSRKYAWRSSDW